jgi:hypothetical protein
MKWESPDVEGDPPEDRVQHSFLTLDNEKMLITGGKKPLKLNEDGTEADSSKLPQADFDGVHVLMCEKGVWKWAPSPNVTGDKPTIIARHTTCLIPVGKKVICFGGLDETGKRNSDLRILAAQNIMNMDWVHVPLHVPAEPEAAEGGDAKGEETGTGEGGAAAADTGAAAGAGGAAPSEETPVAEEGENDAGKPAGEEEDDDAEKPPPPLVPPGDRIGCGSAFVDGRIYVFGGNATHEDGQRLFTNVLTLGTFEGNSKTFERGTVEVAWENVEVKGDIPPPRSDFIMTILDGKICVYGGYNKDGSPLDDMYVFDADTHEWTAMYMSDASTTPASPICAFVQKKLISVAATRSSYDDVRVLDFGKIMEQATFAPRMAQRVTEELDKLYKWEELAMKDLKIETCF